MLTRDYRRFGFFRRIILRRHYNIIKINIEAVNENDEYFFESIQRAMSDRGEVCLDSET